jgi:NAD(P)-dependent dehydrogenase (short-subunit alcohol dehydrogenase family)
MIRELDEQAGRTSRGFRRAGATRYGQPQNIADVVAFLASREAEHVNGAAWVVDAGITAG